MTTYLVDINILIALLDINHDLHTRALNWFLDSGRHGWHSCPTTQSGVIRIMGGRWYGPTRLAPDASGSRLRSMMEGTSHSFVPDDASLLDPDVVNLSLVGTGGDVTDAYLLRLAVAHHVSLATMDGRLNTAAVTNGDQHLYVIPSS